MYKLFDMLQKEDNVKFKYFWIGGGKLNISRELTANVSLTYAATARYTLITTNGTQLGKLLRSFFAD